MQSVKFIEHRGKRILLILLTNADLDGLVEVLRETKRMIVLEPLGSVLTLIDVTGLNPTPSVIRVLKDLAAFDRPYVKAAAAVGVSAERRVEFANIVNFSDRTIAICATLEEAEDWLASQ